MLIIKTYLRQRGLNEVFSGGLSSYSISLMAIHMLQMFYSDPRSVHNRMATSLGKLLIDFFHLYGWLFNYDAVAISVRDGGQYLSKQYFDSRPGANNGRRGGYLNMRIAIEDPQNVVGPRPCPCARPFSCRISESAPPPPCPVCCASPVKSRLHRCLRSCRAVVHSAALKSTAVWIRNVLVPRRAIDGEPETVGVVRADCCVVKIAWAIAWGDCIGGLPGSRQQAARGSRQQQTAAAAAAAAAEQHS